MLTKTDILRSHFAPNEVVHFPYRRSTLTGVLMRMNPKRAVVRVDTEEYNVPYECLTPAKELGQQCTARIRQAHDLAVELMHRHGLKNWEFGFDHSTRRAGCCSYQDNRISISFDLACNASEADVRDTILHEIAHALVGRKHNHDPVWKARAREIGCSGDRCHRLRFAPPRYTVTCENRCWTHTAERRNARLICRTCHGKLIYTPCSTTA